MKVLILSITYSFLFFESALNAQYFKIVWGDNIKGVESFGDAVQMNNGHYVAIKQQKIVRTNDHPNSLL